MEYKYKKGKFIKNGHTMFEEDVLTDLKRLAYLEEERTKQLALCSVGNCNCNNGNDFFEEQYLLQHLINDTWQVVGEKTNTVWKQGTKENCQEWIGL